MAKMLVYFVLISCLQSLVISKKILILVSIATRSETHLLNPIANALLDRGHHVTLVTPSSSSISHSNLTEIVPVKPLNTADFVPDVQSVLDLRHEKDNSLAEAFTIWNMSYVAKRCHQTFSHPEFQVVLKETSYDLVLTSSFFYECFLGIIHKVKAPHILLSSMPLTKLTLDITGLRTPLSFVPNPLVELTENMNLKERIVNVLSQWIFVWQHYYSLNPELESIYKQYLGSDLPGVDEMGNNISLIFSNTHYSINFPRPLMPNVIEVGGLHCRPSKPLPKDLEGFASASPNGFIFFSLGTVFKDELMPASLKKVFLNVFSRLKVNVLWKTNAKVADPPKNVKIVNWAPQQDILGHPNLKLFVSHGGLLSTHEATYHGVPVLGLPVFVDQDVNLRRIAENGYGKKLEVRGLTEDELENGIHSILNDPSFRENAKTASDLFRDQLETPLERAVYWMEYVIRHKGAPKLRSHARNLSYIEYHLYDIQLIFLFTFIAFIFILSKAVQLCMKIMKRNEKTLKTKKA